MEAVVKQETKEAVVQALQIKRPRDVRFWIAIAVMVLAAAAFAVIAYSVWETAPILKQEMQVSVWLHTHGNPVFSALLFAVTQIHSPVGMGVMALIVAVFIWRHGDRYWVLSLALALGGGMLLNTALKFAFGRDRPKWDDPLLTTLTSQSFPSGHTAGATLFYGFLAAYMVWRMKNNAARILAVLVCVLMVTVVGFSRVYLGAHYVSDVLAAASFSTAWLVFSLIAVRYYAKRRSGSAPAAA
jgi:membrane-associated phospholipid phosphatase